MALFSFANLSVWKEDKFRRDSLQLDQFLRGDFSSIAREIAAAYPQTKGMPERYIPLVQKFADELSGLYARPVVRKFTAPELQAEHQTKLGDAYLASELDEALNIAEQYAWVQNTALIVLLPGDGGRVRLHVFAPWEAEVTTGRAMDAADPTTWQRLELLVPGEIHQGGGVVDGRLVLTPTEAWEESGVNRKGIYNAAGTNPLGRIPVVVVRRGLPQKGRVFAPINEALLNLQIAICLQDGDTEFLIRKQAYGQWVINSAETGQQVTEISMGPDKVMALVKADAGASTGPSLSIVGKDPPISQIVTWMESRIRMMCSMLGLSADAFLRVNTALTASARLFSELSRRDRRDKIRPAFVKAERPLAALAADTLNLSAVLQVPSAGLLVDVRYQDTTPIVDQLAAVQALKAGVELGVDSRVDFIAARDNVDRDVAAATFKRNLQENLDHAAPAAAVAPVDPALSADPADDPSPEAP